MATTLGGQTLAEPIWGHEGYERTAEDIGVLHTMINGGAIYDYIGTRYRFRLKWSGITGAERDVILTRYLVKTAQSFSPPNEAGSYTVLVVPGSWRESYIESDATARYDCELDLVETTV